MGPQGEKSASSSASSTSRSMPFTNAVVGSGCPCALLSLDAEGAADAAGDATAVPLGLPAALLPAASDGVAAGSGGASPAGAAPSAVRIRLGRSSLKPRPRCRFSPTCDRSVQRTIKLVNLQRATPSTRQAQH